MPDREKVIKALECCMKWTGEPNTATCHCSDCSYTNIDVLGERCLIDLINDALALLKEQKAKPPAIMQDVDGIWSTCSMCGHKLRPFLAMKMDTYIPKFCSECGQAVKWE